MIKNKKHLLFLDNYFLCKFNASQAYMNTYKQDNEDLTWESAKVLACNLLKRPEIIEEISIRQKEINEKHLISRDELIQDLIDIKNSQKDASAIAALRAIEIILKANGWNEPEKFENIGDQNLEIKINVVAPSKQKEPKIKEIDTTDATDATDATEIKEIDSKEIDGSETEEN